MEIGLEYTEKYHIEGNRCTCLKQESTGLPCSHLIKYITDTKRNIYDSIIIHPRWILNDKQPYKFSNDLRSQKVVVDETTNVIYDNEKERFILLRSQSIALATVAFKNI